MTKYFIMVSSCLFCLGILQGATGGAFDVWMGVARTNTSHARISAIRQLAVAGAEGEPSRTGEVLKLFKEIMDSKESQEADVRQAVIAGYTQIGTENPVYKKVCIMLLGPYLKDSDTTVVDCAKKGLKSIIDSDVSFKKVVRTLFPITAKDPLLSSYFGISPKKCTIQ